MVFISLTGKISKKPEKEQGRRVVLDMVKIFEGTGRRVVFDNFFTSVPLCQDLLKKGFVSVGTVRPNKKEIPTEFLAFKKIGKKQMGDVKREIGSCLQVFHDQIMLTSWIPKQGKNILLLSTDPNAIDEPVPAKSLSDKIDSPSHTPKVNATPTRTRRTNQNVSVKEKVSQAKSCYFIFKQFIYYFRYLIRANLHKQIRKNHHRLQEIVANPSENPLN